VLHPVVTTSIAGNVGAAIFGAIVGLDYDAALKMYYTKVFKCRDLTCKLRYSINLPGWMGRSR